MAKAHGDKDTSVFPDEATDVGEKNGKKAKKVEEKKQRAADPGETLKKLQEIVLDDDEGEATPEKPEDRIAELLADLDAEFGVFAEGTNEGMDQAAGSQVQDAFDHCQSGRRRGDGSGRSHLLMARAARRAASRELSAAQLTSLNPAGAQIGGADVTLRCIGSGFVEGDTIVFNGGEETTVFVGANELTTIVRPSTAGTAGAFPVLVRCDDGDTQSLDFTFTEAAVIPPPGTMTAAEAMEELKTGNTEVIAEVAPGELSGLRRIYKEWANDEQDRLKAGYDNTYNEILRHMGKHSIPY